MGYYLAIKMSKLMIHATTCMDFKNIILSERRLYTVDFIYKNPRTGKTNWFTGNQKVVATLRVEIE